VYGKRKPKTLVRLWWQECSAAEIIERAKDCDIALLPLGSIEQHGYHLPTGEDSWHSIKILEKVAKRTGAIILPPPWYGAHPYWQMGQPANLPLRFETWLNLYTDIIHGAAASDYNKFIILNCHGQEWAVPSLVQKLGGEGYFVLAPTLWDIRKEKWAEVLDTYFLHAGEAETSLGLYLVPHLVDMDKAKDKLNMGKGLLEDKWYIWPLVGKFEEPGSVPSHEQLKERVPMHYTFTGAPPEREVWPPNTLHVWGYATKATAEKGKKIVNFIVDWLVDLIEEIITKYPPGVNPLKKQK